ncbi:MAG TPA: hypothetical protein VFB43_17960 [Terracidiphilus sp.]|nr:hypothetical protein [Terracidiphilus sp.]
MAIGTESAVSSVELEDFAPLIPSLIPMSDSLYSLAKDRFESVPVSVTTTAGSTVRPSFRVPFRAQGGAAIAQGTGNGDALGRGNASVWQDFVLSPVWHYAVNEITHLAQLATRGKGRAKISLRAEEMKNAYDSAIAGIEGIMYGDSSGAITQIPATATVSSNSGTGNNTSFITGIRAMAFTDNQVIQVFPSEGGASRGTATISVNDPASSTLFFSTVLPSTGGATQVGDFLMIAGSSGALGQGVYGTTSWINNATAGTQAGIDRAKFPNRITSPSVNLAGGSVTASLSGRILALLGRAMGADNQSKDSAIFLIGEDQRFAIDTTTYYNKQIVIQGSTSDGNTGKTPDVSKKYFSGTYGGRETHVSYVQPLGRIDLMLTKEWTIGELVPLQLYDFGNGVTSMPVPDPSGNGWLTSNQFAFESSFNIACSAPKHQLYVYGASEPTI